MMDWLRRNVLHRSVSTPVAHVESSRDELRERRSLQAELDRHGTFIERHVDSVTDRIRADYRMQDDRLAGRR